MPGDVAEVRALSLASVPATAAERRVALAVVAVSVAVFAAAAPLGGQALAPVPAFLPLYQSALMVCDLITAALLFGQFRIWRVNALLALAGGYLFSAAMAVTHVLSFPGLFS